MKFFNDPRSAADLRRIGKVGAPVPRKVRTQESRAGTGVVSAFAVGQLVEVRSSDEILATLDMSGRLDGMPFMPEMLAFCGMRFRVYKSAHKTCDTVFPIRGRSLDRSIHLATRCDGSAHGGCQAGCLLFWKDAWLKPVVEKSDGDAGPRRPVQVAPLTRASPTPVDGSCTLETLSRTTKSDDGSPDGPVYSCQATQLPRFTGDLSPFDLRQYIRDLKSGNVGIGDWFRGILYINYNKIINLGVGVGPVLRWLYDRVQGLRGGVPYPRRLGSIPIGQPTPACTLNLQVGELVRVKPYTEILRTINTDSRNRGMKFDAEQVPYCGRTFRVLKRVNRIIHEETGRMMELKTPCIILDGVVCRGHYSECRMFCPREIYSYWREIWLERVDAPSDSSASHTAP